MCTTPMAYVTLTNICLFGSTVVTLATIASIAFDRAPKVRKRPQPERFSPVAVTHATRMSRNA